jgi:TPP-dependent pyruvate/acetoin dehydrogenase alpha subunit
MHLIDPSAGVMGTSAVVGTTIPNAVGYAYALKYQQNRALAASFFGDGATEEGVFAESLNFAALKRVPILFVCENNRYAIHTHQSRRQATPAICDRVRAHGIPAERFDDNDMLYLHQRAREITEAVRAGAGPYFLEVMTYRWREHVGPGEDYHLGFRTKDEAAPWIENDQVIRLERLLDAGTASHIRREVEAEIAAAFSFAENSPWPEPCELYTDVVGRRLAGRDAPSRGA